MPRRREKRRDGLKSAQEKEDIKKTLRSSRLSREKEKREEGVTRNTTFGKGSNKKGRWAVFCIVASFPEQGVQSKKKKGLIIDSCHAYHTTCRGERHQRKQSDFLEEGGKSVGWISL